MLATNATKHATKDLTKIGPVMYSKMSPARVGILFVEDSNKTAATVNYHLSAGEGMFLIPACSSTVKFRGKKYYLK